MNPSGPANRMLKHNKPQFYIGKTDLTRRRHWNAGALLGTKIHPVGPFRTQINYKNKQIQPHSGQRAVLMCSIALHCDFIAHIVLKSWNR